MANAQNQAPPPPPKRGGGLSTAVQLLLLGIALAFGVRARSSILALAKSTFGPVWVETVGTGQERYELAKSEIRQPRIQTFDASVRESTLNARIGAEEDATLTVTLRDPDGNVRTLIEDGQRRFETSVVLQDGTYLLRAEARRCVYLENQLAREYSQNRFGTPEVCNELRRGVSLLEEKVTVDTVAPLVMSAEAVLDGGFYRVQGQAADETSGATRACVGKYCTGVDESGTILVNVPLEEVNHQLRRGGNLWLTVADRTGRTSLPYEIPVSIPELGWVLRDPDGRIRSVQPIGYEPDTLLNVWPSGWTWYKIGGQRVLVVVPSNPLKYYSFTVLKWLVAILVTLALLRLLQVQISRRLAQRRTAHVVGAQATWD